MNWIVFALVALAATILVDVAVTNFMVPWSEWISIAVGMVIALAIVSAIW